MSNDAVGPDSCRSRELMSRDDTVLIVVDMQERLIPEIQHGARVAWNVGRLVDGGKTLGIPVIATEQYPRGLGPTIKSIDRRLAANPATTVFEKLSFSCRGCSEINEWLVSAARSKVVVAGIEAHVCVQQTALDLLAAGFLVYVAADAVGSRHDLDYKTALARMDSAGATVTTTEAALFEWCEVAGTTEFKRISSLVRDQQPDALEKRPADS